MDDLSKLITLISYANSVYSSGMQLARQIGLVLSACLGNHVGGISHYPKPQQVMPFKTAEVP